MHANTHEKKKKHRLVLTYSPHLNLYLEYGPKHPWKCTCTHTHTFGLCFWNNRGYLQEYNTQWIARREEIEAIRSLITFLSESGG